MRKSKTNPEDIKRLKSEGHTYRQINREIGATMYMIAKHTDNKRPVKVIPTEVKEAITEMVLNGVSVAEIRDITGVSDSSVRRIASRLRAQTEAQHHTPFVPDEYKKYVIIFHAGRNLDDALYRVIATHTVSCYPNYFDMAAMCAKNGIYYDDFVDVTPSKNATVHGIVLVGNNNRWKSPTHIYYTIIRKVGGPPLGAELYR